MGVSEIIVRDSLAPDVRVVQRIYARHVREGLGSFEETPPSLAEIRRRRRKVLGLGLPFLVAEIDRKVVGYSYAAPFRERSAYRYTLENSVYVDANLTRKGVGRALLSALIRKCEAGPWRQMIAVIGDSGNAASIVLHKSLGFRFAGNLHSVGFKHGRWVDSVLMQRELGVGARTLPSRHSQR
jgi:L-amino acid N-acyltransferase YncA